MFGRTASRHTQWDLAILAALAVIAVAGTQWLTRSAEPFNDQMAVAASRMHDATTVLAEYRVAHGLPLDPDDVNQTGLIGTFFSSLTTTIGTLEAKRTTTNPNMAALAVRLLIEAGVRDGDAIAVGASGSFPAILLAVLCAADALDLDIGLIVSLGASQWGANLVEFTWLEMQDVLIRAGLLPSSYSADAVSFGGTNDVGTDLPRDVRDALRMQVAASGVPLIEEPELPTNVAERTRVYRDAVGGKPIAAFVNIGGAWANVGAGEAPLALSPGVNIIEVFPTLDERGTLFEFAMHGLPVIHFLHTSALVSTYGLPWDPSPLPAPGESMTIDAFSSFAVRAIAATYILIAGLWLNSIRNRQRIRRTNAGW